MLTPLPRWTSDHPLGSAACLSKNGKKSFAEIIQEETLESNRVSLCNTKGEKVVSIYPRVSGSISDKDVVADPEKYEGKTRAEEAMLTPDMLQWSLGATIGIKLTFPFGPSS